MGDTLVTIRGCCARLTLSRSTVWRLCRDGELPAVQLTSSRVAFRERDIEAFISQRVQAGGATGIHPLTTRPAR